MGRPGRDHRGLPCEPGRCLCQDIVLLAQLPVLTAQTGQLLTLGAGRAVLSAAFITIGLSHPVPDRLGGRFELPRQRLRGAPRSHQINHLSPEWIPETCTSFSALARLAIAATRGPLRYERNERFRCCARRRG